MIIHVLYALSVENILKIEVRLKRMEVLMKLNVEKLEARIDATINILLKLQNGSIEANISLVRSGSFSRIYTSVITIDM